MGDVVLKILRNVMYVKSVCTLYIRDIQFVIKDYACVGIASKNSQRPPGKSLTLSASFGFGPRGWASDALK